MKKNENRIRAKKKIVTPLSVPTTHAIVNADSREMKAVADKSVHLVITSPPYWQLKDYGTENQIGFHDDYESYINHLNLTWSECYRVLHDGCRLCVNIGDQFARATYYGRYKVIPIHSEIIKFCETIGFDFMGKIIWQKVTTMNSSGGASIMGSFPYPRNGIVKLDFEYILLFKKQGKSPKPTNDQKSYSKMTTEEWNTYFNGHWNFSGARQDKHLAMFPEELPLRLIKMFSFVGEVVLDPFMGSGTTASVSKKLNRNSIGYEINPEFIPIIKDKIEKIEGVGEVTILEQKSAEKKRITEETFENSLSKLPYKFIDFHKLDKKIDVKKKQYGSRLDANSNRKREEFFTVKEILSPYLIKLNNDVTIRLLGIKENPLVNGKANEYLEKKIKGKKVFLKYENALASLQANPMVYLYLENKTFINAHLLKNKLALVDNSIEYKHKNKFNKLVNI